MMKTRTIAVVAALSILFLSEYAQATVIVTVSPTSTVMIGIGETATLSVFGESNTGSGIFGWDVSVHVDDPTIVGLLPDTLDRTGWTNNSLTSSDGMVVANGIEAIYDTEETVMTKGVGAPVQLFSVDFRGLALGKTTLRIDPDQTTGADFVTWATEVGGNYEQASVMVMVIPEPTSAFLITVAAGVFVSSWSLGRSTTRRR